MNDAAPEWTPAIVRVAVPPLRPQAAVEIAPAVVALAVPPLHRGSVSRQTVAPEVEPTAPHGPPVGERLRVAGAAWGSLAAQQVPSLRAWGNQTKSWAVKSPWLALLAALLGMSVICFLLALASDSLTYLAAAMLLLLVVLLVASMVVLWKGCGAVARRFAPSLLASLPRRPVEEPVAAGSAPSLFERATS